MLWTMSSLNSFSRRRSSSARSRSSSSRAFSSATAALDARPSNIDTSPSSNNSPRRLLWTSRHPSRAPSRLRIGTLIRLRMPRSLPAAASSRSAVGSLARYGRRVSATTPDTPSPRTSAEFDRPEQPVVVVLGELHRLAGPQSRRPGRSVHQLQPTRHERAQDGRHLEHRVELLAGARQELQLAALSHQRLLGRLALRQVRDRPQRQGSSAFGGSDPAASRPEPAHPSRVRQAGTRSRRACPAPARSGFRTGSAVPSRPAGSPSPCGPAYPPPAAGGANRLRRSRRHIARPRHRPPAGHRPLPRCAAARRATIADPPRRLCGC